eukprot:scaffold7011_cov112-Isochrysis_galbana.AAC.9
MGPEWHQLGELSGFPRPGDDAWGGSSSSAKLPHHDRGRLATRLSRHAPCRTCALAYSMSSVTRMLSKMVPLLTIQSSNPSMAESYAASWTPSS